MLHEGSEGDSSSVAGMRPEEERPQEPPPQQQQQPERRQNSGSGAAQCRADEFAAAGDSAYARADGSPGGSGEVKQPK